VSLDRGASWQRFMTGLPTVPVHDLEIHPRDRELIAATHGRSIWIVDVAPLQQLADSVLAAPSYLFAPKVAYEFGDQPVGGGSSGHKWYSTSGRGSQAEIVYRLTAGERRQRTSLVITGVRGDTIRTLQGPGGPGVHRVTWDFRGRPPEAGPLSPAQRRDSIALMRRLDVVFDSLAQAGMNKTLLDRLAEGIRTGNLQALAQQFGFGGGGGGGFGGGQPGRFVERPGETSGPAPRAAAQTEGATEEGAEPQLQQGQLQDILRLLRPPGQRGAGGGFNLSYGTYNPARRGPAPMVETGDYLVSLTVGNRTMSQVLRVVRMTGGAGAGFFAGEDDR
jgi:hypothetical protein